MIKTIKQTIKNLYYWIKEKLVKFKKWIIYILIGSAVLAAPSVMIDTPVELPVDLPIIELDKLKDKDFIKSIREADNIVVKRNFTKTYNSKEKRIIIKNDKQSIDMELLSPYHKMVMAGSSVLVAEIKLNDWKGKNKLFDSLEFYNRKEYTKEDKQFVFKYCEEITTQMELFPNILEEEKKNKILKVIGDWDNAVEFTNLDELPHKDIRIGIFTETILGEKIEWVSAIDGFYIYEWAAYDVTQINSLEHDTNNGTFNSLVQIDATHYILAYDPGGSKGRISTFSIDGSYVTTELNSLEHESVAQAAFNSLVKIDATHFILAYGGVDNDGYIKTFSIDGSYAITEIDSLEHDGVQGARNSLIQIDATHYMLAYMGLDNDGYIKTFSIDGSFNITEIDSLEHDTTFGYDNTLVKIDATHFALAYGGDSLHGYIKTFSIDGSFNITQVDVIEHDTGGGYEGSLILLDSTHLVLAYWGNDDGAGLDGFIKTFSLDGSFNLTEVDVLEHDTINGRSNSLVKIDDTHFILAYAGDGNDGYITTFSIDGSYNITKISSIEHDENNGFNNSLVKIDATHFILAYGGVDNDGYIKTFSIEVAPEARRMFLTQ